VSVAADVRLRGNVALLAPRSVGIIGASADPTRIGGRAIAYMLERGFTGPIYPVNPNRAEIQGLKAFGTVADMPTAPDVAIVALPAAQVAAAVSQLADRGVAAAIVFSSGFAEVGADGEALQDQMVAGAARTGMRLLGPNTLGAFDARTGFYGTFASVFLSGFPKVGRVGIASQSGAYCGHLVSLMRARGLGIASCLMTGNEAEYTVADAIAGMVADDGIDVIAVYSEGIKDGAHFVAALKAARDARKPVVMMKVGRSKVGEAAAISHTASIAGSDRVTSAVLAEFGAIRARTTEEMLDIAQLATRRIYPVGNTLGVLTVSGGGGVVIADAAEDAGLPMPPMPDDAQARLKALLPICSPVNPVDCTAQALNQLELFGAFTQAIALDGGYRSLLSFLSYTAYAPLFSAKLRAELGKVRDAFPDRLHVVSIIAAPETIAAFEADGISVFEDPSRAVHAIAAMGHLGEAFARGPSSPPPQVTDLALPAKSPSEADAKRLLAATGITIAEERLCVTAAAAVLAAAAIGYPVVMKIVSADIIHKTEIGGVLLGITDADQVHAGFATLLARAKEKAPMAAIDGVLVARQLTGGIECILGITRDPVFGPIAVFGLGGIFVEVMQDVVMRRCPFGLDVAETMIRSIKGLGLLAGARGRAPSDISALADMLSRLSVVGAQAGPSLRAIDLNPVIVMPHGQGAFAVDAVIEMREEQM
jgi:acetate---CoA ligase (ADP-forming)